MTKHVEILTHVVSQLSVNVLGTTDAQLVKLKDGGVLITSPDGDHVHIFVQSVHFEPGEALPF